jgi:hypothetical protein
MSGDPEQEYFSDGISEDIITDLSKIGGLLVISRNSSFTYKGRAVDVRAVGRELGVRSALEGSIRRAGNRVRITAQLIDTATGGHLWADRYDRDLTDIFPTRAMPNQLGLGGQGVSYGIRFIRFCSSPGAPTPGLARPFYRGPQINGSPAHYFWPAQESAFGWAWTGLVFGGQRDGEPRALGVFLDNSHDVLDPAHHYRTDQTAGVMLRELRSRNC